MVNESDRKKSVENSVMKYYERQKAKENSLTPSRKNNAPERETEKQVLAWSRLNNFHVHVVEASAYDRMSGQMGEAKAEAGFPDVTGNTDNGLSCYIELKALGRRSTLSDIQRIFLENKIEQNCFAVVVDSGKKLEQFWFGYCDCKTGSERKAYLYNCLPKQKGSQKSRDSFEEEFGF